MADIALRTNPTLPAVYRPVQRSIRVGGDATHVIQHTAQAGVDITEGQAVRFDANGRWALASAGAAGTADAWGIALKTVKASMGLTALRRGYVEGLNIDAIAFGAPIYLSNTNGALADAAGTVSVKVGRVVPVPLVGPGQAQEKIAFLEFTS